MRLTLVLVSGNDKRVKPARRYLPGKRLTNFGSHFGRGFGSEAQYLLELVAPQFLDKTELQLKLLDSYLRLNNKSKLPSFLSRLQSNLNENTRFAFDVSYLLVRYEQVELATRQLDNTAAQLEPKLKGLTEQDLKSPAHRTLRQDVGELHFIRGMVAVSQGNKGEAMRLFQEADGYYFPARDSLQMQMLAEALFRMEEYPLSLQAYGLYLKYFPSDNEARMRLALGYYFSGSFAKAKDNLQMVLEQAPQTPKLHLYLGLSFLELKSNEEAGRQFQEELKADPGSYQAMAGLAYLDYLNEKNENCRQWLEKARALNPDWVEINMVFGLLYNRLHQFDMAIKSLEQALKQNPNYARAHYQLSLAYRGLGNEAQAKVHNDIYERLTTEIKSRKLGIDSEPKD